MKYITSSATAFTLGALAILFEGCHTTADNKQGRSSFTGKEWQMQKLTVSPSIDWDLDGTKDTDIFELLESCDRDDLLLFREDGVVVRKGNEEKCDEDEDEQWDDGVWKYDASEAKLTLLNEGNAEVSKVLTSTSSTLVLEHRFRTTIGEEHAMIVEYRARP